MAKPTKQTFYRPHARVQEHGYLINPHTGDVTTPPSLTKQEFKREADINNILKQYSKTGMLTHLNVRAAQGMYADLPDALDFQESLHLVRQAEATFMTLPAKLRDRFGNDPAQFLAFCSDPRNLEEMRELGLALKPPLPSSSDDPPSSPPGGSKVEPKAATTSSSEPSTNGSKP